MEWRFVTNPLPEHMVVPHPEISDDDLTKIGVLLETRHSFSIANYKIKYMKRRIALRMRACRCTGTAAYLDLLHNSEAELNLLRKGLTIHVSHFFRNPTMFEKLRTNILPAILHAAPPSLTFRSLGCAGGEEAYSLALLLQEHFPQEIRHIIIEIHGLDIDADILHTATQALYQEDRLKEITPLFRARYFSPQGAHWQLAPSIREMVTFHNQDIMELDTLSPCDIILCRNTLIYFAREDQEKILLSIARMLSTGGILVLGKSETLTSGVRHYFTSICSAERIYRKL